MNLSLSAHIGFRYWRARKANAFASFITFFSVSGILLGVAALIIVSSVMNGLEGQLKQRILGAVPQLTVTSEQALVDWQAASQPSLQMSDVVNITPSIGTQAMLQAPKSLSAAQIYGIYPEFEPQNTNTRNDFSALEAGKYRIILGYELARRLDLTVGEKVRVLSGDGVVYSPLGPVPSQRKFTVAGVFETGSQVDAGLAYVHFEDAQRLMRQSSGNIHQLRYYLSDPFKAASLKSAIEQSYQHQGLQVSITDWRDSYGHLFAAVKMEKNMMSLMLSLIIAVAAFNIVSALVMMVTDKTTDVAVLKTQGLTTGTVMGIFMIQGSLNAILGLIAGLIIGIFVTLNLNGILSVLGVSVLGAGTSLPVEIGINQISGIIVGTLVITFLATVYPALRAANVQPATALRYE
ncbi:lipoprotein-releasing ABC transporter permease subunit [Shewanella sp. Scap07]|uniref:lipoprotein-releasing ABC transporter permease subunit n=1 Tax=Shewanella sp. Scap07 TaxID=2589987 RepID=UPI0015BCF158|nr:lipoprotein-releasing ABC transporter permease subunit [Shewanella sp. Scap07]QLE85904.1 lipoprotein-releasing ABC transporter permease subunit [Shewanella sp. Scap07]